MKLYFLQLGMNLLPKIRKNVYVGIYTGIHELNFAYGWYTVLHDTTNRINRLNRIYIRQAGASA